PRASAIPPGFPADSLPNITRIYTHPAAPNDSTPTVLVLLGNFPFPCGAVHSATVIDPHHVSVFLTSRPPCTDSNRTWLEAYNLGVLTAGEHWVRVDVGTIRDSVRVVKTGYFRIFVAGRDTTPPVQPPTEGLPYIVEVRIAPHSNAVPIPGPICPDDSILVLIDGRFPSDCLDIRDTQVVFPFDGGLPVVRMLVVDRRCEGATCQPGS